MQFAIAIPVAFLLGSLATQGYAADEGAVGCQSKGMGIVVMDFYARSVSEEADRLRVALPARLASKLAQRKDIRVLERERLQGIVSELELARTGMISPETAGQIGKVISADFLIMGTVLVRGQSITANYSLIDTQDSAWSVLGREITGPKADIDGMISGMAASLNSSLDRASLRGTLCLDAAVGNESRPSIAVLPILSGDIPNRLADGAAISESIMLDLVRSERFRVVERSRLDAILKEWSLQASGAVDPASVIKTGRLLGADWLVYGHFYESAKNRLGISLRLTKVETGEIRIMPKYEGEDDWLLGRDSKLAESIIEDFGKKSNSGVKQVVGDVRAKRLAETGFYSGSPGSVLTPGEEGSETRKRLLRADTGLRAALYADPSCVRAYLELARVSIRLGENDEAKKIIHSMLARSPEWIDQSGVAQGYALLGEISQCEESVGYFRRALEIGNLGYQRPIVRDQLARCYQTLGQYRRAVEIREEMWREDSVNWERWELGRAYELAGEYQAAIKVYEGLPKAKTIFREPVFGGMLPGERIALLRGLHKYDKGAMDLYLAAESAGCSETRDAQLEELLRLNTGKSIADRAQLLLAANNVECRRGAEKIRQAFRKLVSERRGASDFGVVDAYIRSIPPWERRKDFEFLAEWFPKRSMDRLLILHQWASFESDFERDHNRAAGILEEILVGAEAFSGDARVRSMAEEAKRTLEWMKSGTDIWSWSTADDFFADALARCREHQCEQAGRMFSAGGFAVEANWAWPRYISSPHGYGAMFILGLARSYECLQIWTEAVRVYQRVLDMNIVNSSDTGWESRVAQWRIDDILKSHLADPQAESESKEKLQYVRRLQLELDKVLDSSGTIRAASSIPAVRWTVGRDCHGHCPFQYTVLSGISEPSAHLGHILARLEVLVKDPSLTIRREAASGLALVGERLLLGADELGGFGLEIDWEGEYLVVADAPPGFPASRAGIRRGFRIREVDGQRVHSTDLDWVRDKLKDPNADSLVLKLMWEERFGALVVNLVPDRVRISEAKEKLLRILTGAMRDGDGEIRISAAKGLAVLGQIAHP